ncbi:hypothetical protein SDC9_159170 [bioreactor metagenome]|uniref:Uncharacterized protein n=1 Tax=bioreactor metagenome TaxID=1076179 RepID=A0A645FEF9_9ZZZZ
MGIHFPLMGVIFTLFMFMAFGQGNVIQPVSQNHELGSARNGTVRGPWFHAQAVNEEHLGFL